MYIYLKFNIYTSVWIQCLDLLFKKLAIGCLIHPHPIRNFVPCSTLAKFIFFFTSEIHAG
jgi:hypothetical protein